MARSDFLVGEMVFARAAHGDKTLRSLSEYIDWMHTVRLPQGGATPAEVSVAKTNWLGDLPTWQKDAEEFIEEAAARVLARHPKIVAFASMFQQTNANIALARRLKKEPDPPIIVVGGANCMGDLGAALIEHIEAYDYVFIGEADEIMPVTEMYDLRDRLKTKTDARFRAIPGGDHDAPIPEFGNMLEYLLKQLDSNK